MRRPDWLVDQLPPAMLQEDFFRRFVQLFQAQADTLMAHADNLEHLPDPDLAPPQMLPWLASWIGLESVDGAGSPELQREVLRTAARTLAWRGTPYGLQSILELFSGAPAVVEDGGGVWRDGEAPDDTAWVVMRVESTGNLTERAFADLVADEVPAHVRAQLWVGDRLVWPRARAEPGPHLATPRPPTEN